MARPHLCRNPACPYAHAPPAAWCTRSGFYTTAAHGRVQRYRCRCCGRRLSAQSESIHYFRKRRLDLRTIFIRVRGGSSMRDIARELGCSPPAVAVSVARLGRQAMSAHLTMLYGLRPCTSLCFDGLVSALSSRDYPTQITTLGASRHELLLAMTHCVTERGGPRSARQRTRIAAKRSGWRPPRGALTDSIALLVNELSRFACPPLLIDTDEHPIYAKLIRTDLALRWYRRSGLLHTRRTPGRAPRTASNPLFLVNYLDRMIRHRVAEHTRQSIAIGRNATMQMLRMWIFAWDHNARQPRRVAAGDARSRAEHAGVAPLVLRRLRSGFFSTRVVLPRMRVPESMRRVWLGQLVSPPVRWRAGQRRNGPRIPAFAKGDLARAQLHDA